MQRKLGILAGGGRLPALVIESCQKSGRDYYVIAFKEQADPDIVINSPHSWVRLGAASESLSILKDQNVLDLVMAGHIHRPSMTQIYPDLLTAKFLARTGILALGDDGLLSAIIKTLETEYGFHIVSPDSVAPDLLSEEGVLSTRVPSAEDEVDILAAAKAAFELGKQDKGQAAIAYNDTVLGLEDAKGTDALLNRIAASRGENFPGVVRGGSLGGVLAKVAKPQQELRIDLPTIGPKTLEGAARAGLNGIVIEAGRSLIIDKQAVSTLADELGLFIIAINVDEAFNE